MANNSDRCSVHDVVNVVQVKMNHLSLYTHTHIHMLAISKHTHTHTQTHSVSFHGFLLNFTYNMPILTSD